MMLPEPLQAFQSQVLTNQALAKYTAVRLGGPADFILIARHVDALEKMVIGAWEAQISMRVLGAGANVLVQDAGFRGLIVINRANQVEVDHEHVRVDSGHSLTTFAKKCVHWNLTGFEWAGSVPGTIGGAVVNNAGAHGGDMSQCVVEASCLFLESDKIEKRTLNRDDLAYGYRSSSLKARADRNFLVLSANLHLQTGDPVAIQEKLDANNAYRKRTQPPGASLGSIFKNPEGDYAGRLIELCGLKGFQMGGAQVSNVHANFFINADHATADDYLKLIEHVRTIVLEKTGITLETEIEVVGN